MTRLDTNWFDYGILGIYFALVVAIGVLARRAIATSEDFLLSGRSLPAWVTGIAFISANLGAIEILGMAANGAQYGLSTVHFYWIGAVPAMVFLGLVMMPFYYGSRVRSVPEYLRRRFSRAAHLWNAISFAVAAVLNAGVNLFAMSIIIEALLGWPQWLAIVIAAGFVLAYVTLGGLSRGHLQRGAAVLRHHRGPDPAGDHRTERRRWLGGAQGEGGGRPRSQRRDVLDLGGHLGRELVQPAR